MNILLYTICFLILNFSVFAKPEGRPVPSDTEVYFFGFIMFVSAMGTLLLIIFILSKLQEKVNPSSINYNSEFRESDSNYTKNKDNKKAFIEKVKVFLKSSEDRPVENNISSVSEVPEDLSHLKKSDVQEDTEAFFLEDEKMPDYNSEVESISRDLLYKLSGAIPCKSVAIFFKESNYFIGFLEKTGTFIVNSETGSKSEITEDMISHLQKKQGAYSVDHREAVLPLFSKDGLFGAIKFKFETPVEELNIASIWGDIKSYSSSIYTAMQEGPEPSNPSVTEVSLFNLEDFYKELDIKFKENSSQNLTLIKVIQTDNLPETLKAIQEILPDLISSQKEVFRVSIDTIGIFFNISERESFSNSLKDLLQTLKKQHSTVEICVGAADYHSNMKVAQKWYERALNTLNEAVAVGPNNYRLYKVD